MADAEPPEQREERRGAGKQRAAAVDGAIHVEGDMREATEALQGFGGDRLRRGGTGAHRGI